MIETPIATLGDVALLLAEPRPWAILPQTLGIITAAALGDLRVDAAVERGTQRSDEREPAPAVEGPAVALLGLRGLITPRGTFMDEVCGGGGGLVAFQAALAEAVEDDDVVAIVLDVDSPGGTTDLVPETAAMIRAAAEQKRVVAVANTLAASAAYWLASQASEVVVTPSGLVGSIGVYTRHVDVSQAEADAGVRTTLVHAGRFKVEGNPHAPLSREARAHLQELVDDVYGQFTADVAAGRGTSPAAVRRGYGEGRVLTAERAVAAGLADRVATLEDTVRGLLTGGAGGPALAAEASPELASEVEPFAVDVHALADGEDVPADAPADPDPPAAEAGDHENVADADEASGGEQDEAAAQAARRARERLAALL